MITATLRLSTEKVYDILLNGLIIKGKNTSGVPVVFRIYVDYTIFLLIIFYIHLLMQCSY